MIDIEDFMRWLEIHKLGINLRYDLKGSEHDLGYITACEVIQAQLKLKIQESNDGGCETQVHR